MIDVNEETILLSDKDWELLAKELEEPSEPSDELRELMREET
jgi:uncharacterized protein (DUF1778 family)